MERECDAGSEEAMGWPCGCRVYSGEMVQGRIVASRCNGRWLRRGSSACARYGHLPSPIGFAWGRISSARAIVGVVGVVWSPCFPAVSFDVGYMMWCWCRKYLAEKLGVCRFLPDTSL